MRRGESCVDKNNVFGLEEDMWVEFVLSQRVEITLKGEYIERRWK